ncbi:MAG: HAD-IB family phosphatase [Clostridia bacterium]|nr:HAD-IB family phosphatase [Clostridia bacterium]
MENKIAIFDFCGTVVPFQSADAFIRYATKNYNVHENKRIEKKFLFWKKSYISIVMSKFFHYSITKHVLAKMIKGMDEGQIQKFAISFFKDEILPNIIHETHDLIIKLKNEGYHLIFVSAAYGVYLQQAANYFGIESIISTNLKIKNGKATGKISKDCVWKNKVKMLKKENKLIDKKYANVVWSISDSKSDLPILLISKNKIVVSKKHQKWIEKYKNFNEIIWEK